MGNGRLISNSQKFKDSFNKLKELLKTDVDKSYYEMLTMAIEYGMTPNEFWNDDIQLIYIYQKAYINRLHRETHLQGLYNELAFSVVIGKAFSKKENNKITYPKEDVYNPFKQEKKKVEQKQQTQQMSMNDMYQLKKKFMERRKQMNG